MSYCKEQGKDRIIFVTEKDEKKPIRPDIAALSVAADKDDRPGLILPNGDINWNCPCMGGMVAGPCGPNFRDAFSCFHYSKADPKGSDCVGYFRAMAECMQKYPNLFPDEKDDEMEDLDKDFDSTDPMAIAAGGSAGSATDDLATTSARSGHDKAQSTKK